jgi:hypothetical protein
LLAGSLLGARYALPVVVRVSFLSQTRNIRGSYNLCGSQEAFSSSTCNEMVQPCRGLVGSVVGDPVCGSGSQAATTIAMKVAAVPAAAAEARAQLNKHRHTHIHTCTHTHTAHTHTHTHTHRIQNPTQQEADARSRSPTCTPHVVAGRQAATSYALQHFVAEEEVVQGSPCSVLLSGSGGL